MRIDETAGLIAPEARRGRGAISNRAGRFEPFQHVAEAGEWSLSADPETDPPPANETQVTPERSRQIITRNDSPDIPFDRSINPYRGCEHGCVYCFARPSHAFLGLSPGLDFERKLTIKPEAARLLEAELGAPRYRPAPIAIGTNTDPYQPIEKQHLIMRSVLEVLRDWHHPVSITTKGALVARDVDLLAELAQENLVHVSLSITSLDAGLSRALEPRATTPNRRLWAVEQLAKAGVPVGIKMAPIIPALNDHEIEAIIAKARDAGAQFAGWIALRLPRELKDIMREWLSVHYPDRARRILGLIRELHGGKEYDPVWGKRMRGEGPFAALIAQRFSLARSRAGLLARPPQLAISRFARPARAGDQLSLF